LLRSFVGAYSCQTRVECCGDGGNKEHRGSRGGLGLTAVVPCDPLCHVLTLLQSFTQFVVQGRFNNLGNKTGGMAFAGDGLPEGVSVWVCGLPHFGIAVACDPVCRMSRPCCNHLHNLLCEEG
jgi:hypothetical protein